MTNSPDHRHQAGASILVAAAGDRGGGLAPSAPFGQDAMLEA